MPSSTRLVLARVALAAALLVAGLGLVELILRGAGRGTVRPRVLLNPAIVLTEDVTVPDPDLLVRLAPDQHLLGHYRINGRGWRGDEVSEAAAPGTLRVACLGDSCTFGFGLTEQDAWPRRLADVLAAAFGDVQPFEVVNTAVPGYSTWQNRMQMEGDVAALSPDVVVVYPSGHNDITKAHRRTDAEQTARNRGLSGWLLDLALARRLLPSDPPPREHPGPAGEDELARVPDEQIEENLMVLVARARQQGARIVLVAPAHARGALSRIPGYARVTEIVRRVARRADVALVDMPSVLEPLAPLDPFLDFVHPDATGAEWIAWSVFTTMVSREGMLPSSPRRRVMESLVRPPVSPGDPSEPPVGPWPPPGAPAVLAAAARAYAGGVPLEGRLPPGLPGAVVRYDPFLGQRRSPYGATACRVLAGRTPDAGRATRLRSRAETIDAFVVPPDGFGEVLGAAKPGRAHPERLARARAAWVALRAMGRPDTTFDVRRAEARRLRNEDRHEEAIALLDEVVALHPGEVHALYERGLLLRRTGRVEEARRSFEAILERAPDDPLGHVLAGDVALRHGRANDAERAARRAVDLDPAHAPARYLLGRVLLARDEPAEALVHLGAARFFARTGELPDVQDLMKRAARAAHGRETDQVVASEPR